MLHANRIAPAGPPSKRNEAARVSEDTAFFNIAGANKPGKLIEMNPTKKIFSVPDEQATEAYISGRFG